MHTKMERRFWLKAPANNHCGLEGPRPGPSNPAGCRTRRKRTAPLARSWGFPGNAGDAGSAGCALPLPLPLPMLCSANLTPSATAAAMSSCPRRTSPLGAGCAMPLSRGGPGSATVGALCAGSDAADAPASGGTTRLASEVVRLRALPPVSGAGAASILCAKSSACPADNHMRSLSS